MAAAAPKGETDTGVCYSGGSRAASGSILNLTYFRSGITRVSNAKKKKKMQNPQRENGPWDRAGDVERRALPYRLCASGAK